MVEYTLIKEYPGSMPIGFKARTDVTPAMEEFIARHCRDYPDFWNAEEIKKPLIISEDMKKLYEGDRCFYINEGTYHYSDVIMDTDVIKHAWFKKFFFSEERAKRYIKLHKPQYSFLDIFRCKQDYVEYNGKKGWYISVDSLKYMTDAKETKV